jgi:hypothetical protein
MLPNRVLPNRVYRQGCSGSECASEMNRNRRGGRSAPSFPFSWKSPPGQVRMAFGFLGVGALYEVRKLWNELRQQDTLLSLPHYPQEDHKLRATALQTRIGGNIPNTLHVLSQVCSREDRLVFLSAFAEKAASKRLTDTLEEKSVEIAGVWRDSPESPRSWILRSEQSGSRTIVNYNEYMIQCPC